MRSQVTNKKGSVRAVFQQAAGRNEATIPKSLTTRRFPHFIGVLYSEAISFSQRLSLRSTLRRNSVSLSLVVGDESGSNGNRILNVVPRPCSLRASIFPP